MLIRKPYWFISLLFTVLFIADHASAEKNVSSSFSSERIHKNISDNPKVLEAVCELGRQWHVNTHHKTIHKNLATILFSPLLSAQQRAAVLRIEDLLDYIENLQNRVDYWSVERDKLKVGLIEKGHREDRLAAQLDNIRKRIGQSIKPSLPRGNKLFDQADPLRVINDFLSNEEERLASQLRYLQEQYDWMKTVHKDKQDASRPQDPIQLSARPISVFSVDPVGPTSRTHLDEAAGDNVLPRPQAVIKFQEKEEDLDLSSKDDAGGHQISVLSEDIVDLSLKMSETERLLQDKKEAVTSLQSKLSDAEQRFKLGEKIIQEKDEEIQNLSKAMGRHPAGVSPGMEGTRASGDLSHRPLADFEVSLQSYREKLAELKRELSGKGKLLNVLEEDLAAIQERFDTTQKTLQEKNEQIAKLHEELSEARQKMSQDSLGQDPFLAKKDKEIKELNGVINIYQYSLRNTVETLREKNEEVEFLNNELGALHEKFTASEPSNDKRDVYIRALKDALLRERGREDLRNENLRQVVKEKDQEIKGLKARLSVTERIAEAATGVLREKMAYLNNISRELTFYRSQMNSAPETMSGSSWSKDEQRAELDGILRIYKDKLSDERKSANEKARLVAVLANRVSTLQSRMGEKDKMLDRTQKDIVALKAKLADIEAELLKVKNHPGHEESRNLDVEQNIHGLRIKFKEIQNFLLENLHEFDKINARLIVP